jgi:CRISPR-associated protein Cmr3
MQIETNTSKLKKAIHKPPFSHLVIIEPLGLLYGSSGRFLSPENLVGRSGTNFPPSAATLSGLFASQITDTNQLEQLQLAGPFWTLTENLQNFHVPTPLNCLVLKQKIEYRLIWHPELKEWRLKDGEKSKPDKYESGTWMAIQDWQKLLQGELPNVKSPYGKYWKSLPHLHPKLKPDERVVDKESEGSLFLENGIELSPEVALVYLTNTQIDTGWYRFGGEGHMVSLHCEAIASSTKELLAQPVGNNFASITPAVWGSNDLSYRAPGITSESKPIWGEYAIETMLMERPTPFRYRLGGEGKAKRLSRGRYAVPAGAVYVLESGANLPCWQDWDENWFPYEAYSFKRWGCGLALPLANE